MLIDYILFSITFIVSAAMAVVGITISHQLYNVYQKPFLQVLLYHQIFMFSFYIYGIWGNIALHQILSDLNLSEGVNSKLTVFIPILGIPFLVVSWFMLLRFSFILNGINNTKWFPLIYFPGLFALILLFTLLVEKNIISINKNPDLFIIRSVTSLNLMVQLGFLIPFFKTKKNNMLIQDISIGRKHVLLYFAGVLLYSSFLFFYNFLGTISVCTSILLLFAVSIFIPLIIRLNIKTVIQPDNKKNKSFTDFCHMYEISKRESEIIIEICTGKSNKDIAEKLFITLQTVKDHNYRIFSKLGVKTRGQLTNLVREKTGI